MSMSVVNLQTYVNIHVKILRVVSSVLVHPVMFSILMVYLVVISMNAQRVNISVNTNVSTLKEVINVPVRKVTIKSVINVKTSTNVYRILVFVRNQENVSTHLEVSVVFVREVLNWTLRNRIVWIGMNVQMIQDVFMDARIWLDDINVYVQKGISRITFTEHNVKTKMNV